MSVNPQLLQQALGRLQVNPLQSQFNNELSKTSRILMDPRYGGYTNSQMANALNFAFGGGSLPGLGGLGGLGGGLGSSLDYLGGVGLQNMGLYGLGPALDALGAVGIGGNTLGLRQSSLLKDASIFGQSNAFAGAGLGGSPIAQDLLAKAEASFAQQNQQKYMNLLQQQQQFQQMLMMKQQMGYPVTANDQLMLQQFAQALQQVIRAQQGGVDASVAQLLGGGSGFGSLPSAGGGGVGLFNGSPLNGLASLGTGGIGNFSTAPAVSGLGGQFFPQVQAPVIPQGFGMQPQFFSGAQPQFGQPQFGQPIYGQPQVVSMPQPGSQQPVFGQPIYGQPRVVSMPQFGGQQPIFGQPILGRPQVVSMPQFGGQQPAFGQPQVFRA